MRLRNTMSVIILLLALAGAVYGLFFQLAPTEPVLDKTGPGKMCPIHGTPLKEGIVPITHGYPMWFYDEKLRAIYYKEREAKESQCPCANSTWYSGGCGAPTDFPTRAIISYCPDCRRAEAAWKATHDHCIP